MPSTWTAYSKRKSVCQVMSLDSYSCIRKDKNDGIITEGEIIVRVRETTTTVDFHTACWLFVAIAIMELTPYAPKGKGRRKLPISDLQRKDRMKLSSRYSAFQSRINAYSIRIMNDDSNKDYLTVSIQIMALKQDKLWYEIQNVGGAPERWRVPDGEEKKRLLRTQPDEGSPLDAGAA